MNNLKLKIMADRMLAMKNGDTEKKNVLSTLVGELDRLSKDPTDEQVLKGIKKLIDSNTLVGNDASLSENKILEKYLPQLMSTDELTFVIEKIVKDNSYSGMKDMGKLMKTLSTEYASRYDGTVASGIVKKLLV